MSGTQGGAERGVGEGHIPCPRCGHLNYPTGAVCLNCGADLDLTRAQGVSALHGDAATESALFHLDPAPAGVPDWRGPALFLLWAALFSLFLPLFVRVTGAKPCPLGLLDLSGGLEVIFGTVAVYETVWERGQPLRPCRSPRAWIAVLILSLGLAGAGLILAFSETREVNQLAAAGRTDLCPARIARRLLPAPPRRGEDYIYQVVFAVGGRGFLDEVPLAMLPPELASAPMGQVRRVPVTWLPQDPAVHRLGGMSPAVPVLFDLLWGLDMFYLVAGLGLVCWYTAPS